MEDGTGHGLSTRCVHAGDVRDAEGALHVPLYNHTTLPGFASTADLLDVLEGRRVGNIYTRYGFNPTIRAVEAKLADLEGAEAALGFSSGMAAESAAILGHVQAGDHVVCIGDVYGGTQELLGWNLPRLGVRSTFLMADGADRLADALEERTHIVFFETPTNPALAVIDIAAAAEAAHAGGALVIVDNTFASPVNQSPLAHGADLVVHSATKYLGGHSDLTAGAVMGSAELLHPIWNWRKEPGPDHRPRRCVPARAEPAHAGGAGAGAVAPSGGGPLPLRAPAGDGGPAPGAAGGPGRRDRGPSDARRWRDGDLRAGRRRGGGRRRGRSPAPDRQRRQPGERGEPRDAAGRQHAP